MKIILESRCTSNIISEPRPDEFLRVAKDRQHTLFEEALEPGGKGNLEHPGQANSVHCYRLHRFR